MKTYSLFEKTDFDVVIALGQFDGLHLGHKYLLEKARILAEKNNAKLALFTIKKESYVSFMVLSFDELLFKAEKIGLEAVIYACENSDDIYSVTKDEFLRLLKTNFRLKGLVCGEDYTFGKDREGDALAVSKFCEENNLDFEMVELYKRNGHKISSTDIRNYLQMGAVEAANNYLGDEYFIMGKVLKGRRVGRQMGFPTANIRISPQKMEIAYGVYKTKILVEGKLYDSITNVGYSPTFDFPLPTVETYILNFNKDIYDCTVVVFFEKFLRKLCKFDTMKQLTEQIQKDISENYD